MIQGEGIGRNTGELGSRSGDVVMGSGGGKLEGEESSAERRRR